jgi:hypothetical protein
MAVAALSLNAPSSVRPEHADFCLSLRRLRIAVVVWRGGQNLRDDLGPHSIEEEKYVLLPPGHSYEFWRGKNSRSCGRNSQLDPEC